MESPLKVKDAQFILHNIFKVQLFAKAMLFIVMNLIKMMHLLFVHKSCLPKNVGCNKHIVSFSS